MPGTAKKPFIGATLGKTALAVKGLGSQSSIRNRESLEATKGTWTLSVNGDLRGLAAL
jgi:hypothetical protein